MPTLGHLPVTMITAGLVDRAIDEWEKNYGRSTVKNTVSALVLVLDEAVRDGIIVRNPAKDRARRKTVGRSFGDADHEPSSPRERPHGRLVVVGHRGDVVPAVTHSPVHGHRQPRAHLHGVLDALPMAERLGCEVTPRTDFGSPTAHHNTARDRLAAHRTAARTDQPVQPPQAHRLEIHAIPMLRERGTGRPHR